MIRTKLERGLKTMKSSLTRINGGVGQAMFVVLATLELGRGELRRDALNLFETLLNIEKNRQRTQKEKTTEHVRCFLTDGPIGYRDKCNASKARTC